MGVACLDGKLDLGPAVSEVLVGREWVGGGGQAAGGEGTGAESTASCRPGTTQAYGPEAGEWQLPDP